MRVKRLDETEKVSGTVMVILGISLASHEGVASIPGRGVESFSLPKPRRQETIREKFNSRAFQRLDHHPLKCLEVLRLMKDRLPMQPSPKAV